MTFSVGQFLLGHSVWFFVTLSAVTAPMMVHPDGIQIKYLKKWSENQETIRLYSSCLPKTQQVKSKDTEDGARHTLSTHAANINEEDVRPWTWRSITKDLSDHITLLYCSYFGTLTIALTLLTSDQYNLLDVFERFTSRLFSMLVMDNVVYSPWYFNPLNLPIEIYQFRGYFGLAFISPQCTAHIYWYTSLFWVLQFTMKLNSE